MTHEQKINYLRIALGLQHVSVNDKTADRIIQTYEKILYLGGSFTLEDAVEIEEEINEKYQKMDNA